jgi:undecaprenyl diphosphate synthase
MLNLPLYLYEKILQRGIASSPVFVKHLLLVLDETDLLPEDPLATKGRGMEKLRYFIKWCHALGIDVISVYISVIREGMDKKFLERACSHLKERMLTMLSKEKASIVLYANAPEPAIIRENESTNGKKITVSIGLGGRNELTKAIKAITKKVKKGEIEPEEIDEKVIESELIFKSEPDLVIRSGATRLADFLIWQSVYSEFYFTDVNWINFRKIDLLRAVRDFQWRERRFGR